MTQKAKQILELCELWRETAIGEDDTINIGVDTEKYRLLENGIQFHDLNFQEIQACCIGLTDVLLMKRLNQINSYDHFYFWSWMGELFLGSEGTYFTREERDIKNLFSTCIRAALADRSDKKNFVDLNASELVSNQGLILAQLSFPLLEAILKKTCREYVDYDGRVLKDFRITNRRNVVHYGRQGKSKISSLKDLLFLLYNIVASPELKKQLTSIREHIKRVDEQSEPFSTIYRWRNSSLHGQNSYTTIGGTILNIVIIIALDSLKENYEELREEVFKGVKFYVQSSRLASTSIGAPWNYYPPFL